MTTAAPTETREGLIRDLMAVPRAESVDGKHIDPTCIGYEGRFIALCTRWPNVALPAAIARNLTRDDLCYGASVGLYDWILTRWQADKPVYFDTFIYERVQEREEVDSWWQYHDLWMHFGDCWYPDEWHPQIGEHWPAVTAILADRLIDKVLLGGFRRRFRYALARLWRRVEVADDPRQGVASLFLEYRRVARHVRPQAPKPHGPMTARERRKERDERLVGL